MSTRSKLAPSMASPNVWHTVMNPVKHAVLDAVRLFIRLFLISFRLFLPPSLTPSTVTDHHGKGTFDWPPCMGTTESARTSTNTTESARTSANITVDNRDFSENQTLVYNAYVNRIHKRARERQAHYWLPIQAEYWNHDEA